MNPEALTIGKERFEVRDNFVIVLRVLDRDEINAYAAATQVLRGKTSRIWTLFTMADSRLQNDARMVVQTALAKLYLSWDKVRRQESVDGYVRRILVNDNISRWRRHRGRTVVSADPVGGEDPGRWAPGDDAEVRLDLATALATLAPRQRAVLVLRYFEDLTERETAQLLGIAVGTVKSQTRDALARLRRLVPELVWHDGPHAQRDEGVPHR